MSVHNAAASPRRSWKHSLSLGGAVVTCPCHLPLLLAVLAGTAVGGWLRQYTLVALLAMVGIFGLALCHGVGVFDRRSSVSAAPRERDAHHPTPQGVETIETQP